MVAAEHSSLNEHHQHLLLRASYLIPHQRAPFCLHATMEGGTEEQAACRRGGRFMRGRLSLLFFFSPVDAHVYTTGVAAVPSPGRYLRITRRQAACRITAYLTVSSPRHHPLCLLIYSTAAIIDTTTSTLIAV